jgi:hypothetical protein
VVPGYSGQRGNDQNGSSAPQRQQRVNTGAMAPPPSPWDEPAKEQATNAADAGATNAAPLR